MSKCQQPAASQSLRVRGQDRAQRLSELKGPGTGASGGSPECRGSESRHHSLLSCPFMSFLPPQIPAALASETGVPERTRISSNSLHIHACTQRFILPDVASILPHPHKVSFPDSRRDEGEKKIQFERLLWPPSLPCSLPPSGMDTCPSYLLLCHSPLSVCDLLEGR